MNLAIEAYINRIDGCPCGDTTIQLYRGADSSDEQATRSKLLVFPKGSKKRLDLQAKDPHVYAHFCDVWNVRNEHMVRGLPTHYIYFFWYAVTRKIAITRAVKLVNRRNI